MILTAKKRNNRIYKTFKFGSDLNNAIYIEKMYSSNTSWNFVYLFIHHEILFISLTFYVIKCFALPFTLFMLSDPQPTLTALVRGPFGRHGWCVQLRHLPHHKARFFFPLGSLTFFFLLIVFSFTFEEDLWTLFFCNS